jgi:hypothetical protein
MDAAQFVIETSQADVSLFIPMKREKKALVWMELRDSS